MKGLHYLMCVGINGKKLEEPFNVGLYPMDLKDKAQKIKWMKIGSENDDYRVCQRISKMEFECTDTKEIFVIKDRGAFTEEAFNNFLNQAE